MNHQLSKVSQNTSVIVLIDNHSTDKASVMWLDEPIPTLTEVFGSGQLISVEVLRWLADWPTLQSQLIHRRDNVDGCVEKAVKLWAISAYEAKMAAEGYNIEPTFESLKGIRLRSFDVPALATLSQLFELSINGKFHYHIDTLKPLMWSQPEIVDYGIQGRNIRLTLK